MERKNCLKLVVPSRGRSSFRRSGWWLVISGWLLVIGLLGFSASQVHADTNTVDFLYDAGGQRIYKGVNEGVHTYYVSAGIEVEISPQGSVTYRKNYYFSGK